MALTKGRKFKCWLGLHRWVYEPYRDANGNITGSKSTGGYRACERCPAQQFQFAWRWLPMKPGG